MSNVTLNRPLRLGMVGGGQDAFIGNVHRYAARLDGCFKLIAGALSSDPEKAETSAQGLGLLRSYADYRVMATAEAERSDGIEVVCIVTPNFLHIPIAQAFLEKGIHVICDKPLSHTLESAEALLPLLEKTQAQFLLTHNYTGYPLVRQAKAMISTGELGDVRTVHVEYAQDWLTSNLAAEGNKQAEWRADPEKAGIGGCIGDIGTHAYNLACFVLGQQAQEVLADLDAFVAGRAVDDNVHMLLRFNQGVKGTLWASQVAPGNDNNLTLRIYGTKGGLEWHQENPNFLKFTPYGEPARLISRGGAGSLPSGERIPAGHPEGYLEGFAALYKEFADSLHTGIDAPLLPNYADGVHGMRFVQAAIKSSSAGGIWQTL